MYEVTSPSFNMQSGSNGSLSSGGSYGSGYYGDPSVTLLGGVAANASATYADMLLQSNTVCYAPTYSTDESPGASCKQPYYHQEGVYGQPGSDCQNSPSTTRYQEAGGHHPGRIVQTSSSSSSPSAAAAAAVAEATAALRLATSTSMFALKPSQPAGAFPLRGPTAEGFAVAARLAAGAAAAAADFVPTSTGLSSWYAQPSAVGFGGTTTSTTYGTASSAFQLSGSSVDDGSTTLNSGIHGFHPAANGFLSPSAGTSGATYGAFQKIPTPWTTPRMTIDTYSSLDGCKCLRLFDYILETCTGTEITGIPRNPQIARGWKLILRSSHARGWN